MEATHCYAALLRTVGSYVRAEFGAAQDQPGLYAVQGEAAVAGSDKMEDTVAAGKPKKGDKKGARKGSEKKGAVAMDESEEAEDRGGDATPGAGEVPGMAFLFELFGEALLPYADTLVTGALSTAPERRAASFDAFL
jgi:hypothetical protein